MICHEKNPKSHASEMVHHHKPMTGFYDQIQSVSAAGLIKFWGEKRLTKLDLWRES